MEQWVIEQSVDSMTPSRRSSFVLRPSSFITDHGSSILLNASLILIGLILAAPLLQAAPLCTDDGSLHIYRTVALDRAIKDGLLYPRWFPDLAYGYGFPFFNYREPLGYYAIEALHLMGTSFPWALNLVLAFSVIASGLTMFWWASDIFDQRAGFVAGVMYMAAPYMLIDSLMRANLPEAIALALMPLSLWAFRRSILFGGRRDFALAVLSVAALLLTHNISSLIFTPVLIAYSLGLIAYRSAPRGPSLSRSFAAIIVALALTAFFWLPALLEGQSAQLYLTHSTRGNDYHFNFLSLSELFGGPGTSDPLLLNPPLRIVIGWAQIAFAVLGGLVLRRIQSREQRVHAVAAIVALMAFLLMALPISVPVWDNLPLIRFVQFPWRFVGRALLPASLLAAAFTHVTLHSSLFTRHVLRIAFYVPLPLIPLVLASPLLYPRICPIKTDLTITDVFAYERATNHIGIDPLGAYLPVTVQERPTGSPLEQQYANRAVIQRLDRSGLPGGVTITREDYRPNQAAIELNTPAAFRATYLTFDFPGWQATIDDQPAPIIPSTPNGLITFDVPAGQHRINVSFGSTPIRTLADILSIGGVIAFIVGLIRIRGQSHHEDTKPPSDLNASASLWFILIPITFWLIKAAWIDPQLTPLRQTQLQRDRLIGVEHPFQIDFGDQLHLLGYSITPRVPSSGETLRVDLYWRALKSMEKNYQTTVGIVDFNGEVWSPKTLDRPRDFQDYPATTQWPTEAYVVDSFELPINPGTPPGEYAIFVEVFERGSLLPLPVHRVATWPDIRPMDALISPLIVTHAARTFDANQLGIYNFKLDRPITSELKLLGLNLDRSDITPGDTILLTAFWQATQKPLKDYGLKFELLDQQNNAVASSSFQLGGERYPSSQWIANEQIVDLDRVRVPANAPSGVYHWRGSIDGGRVFDLGVLRVTAPDRSFEMPTIANRIDQTFGRQVTLLGYEIEGREARGEELRLSLYWRAEEDMPESYKVFVHLLDQNGQVRAQVDTIPVNGTRPTTSWLPSEIVTDTYSITLPPDLAVGQYRLVTGLYDPNALIRLKLITGNDAVTLATFSLQP